MRGNGQSLVVARARYERPKRYETHSKTDIKRETELVGDQIVAVNTKSKALPHTKHYFKPLPELDSLPRPPLPPPLPPVPPLPRPPRPPLPRPRPPPLGV